MNNNMKGETFIITTGLIILILFSYISTFSILSKNSSNSYFSKDDNKINATIKEIEFSKGVLKLYTDNDVMVCVKQTKSTPTTSSLCWKEVKNGDVNFSVYEGKTYFIWLKDKDNYINDSIKYNTNIKK